MIKTDVAAPTTGKLGLVRGPRVQQFWDPRHFLSQQVLALARAHLDRLSPDERELLEGAPVAWDLVALFPPGARWETELPWPSLWGFPVVDTLERLSQQLGQPTSAPPASKGRRRGPLRLRPRPGRTRAGARRRCELGEGVRLPEV